MSDRWKDAAAAVRATKSDAQRALAHADTTARAVAAWETERVKLLRLEHAAAARLLEAFMQEEGVEAIELLAATEKRLIFGEESLEGGFRLVYLIDGGGLKRSVEVGPAWTRDQEDDPMPSISPISVHGAIEAFVEYRRRPATAVAEWLNEQLDQIAQVALKGA